MPPPDGDCAKNIKAGSGGTAIGIADAGGVFFGDGDCLRAGGDVGDVARSDGGGAGVAGCAPGGGGRGGGGGGSLAAPRAAGPATSLFLDLMCCVPAMLILLRRVMDASYVLRWGWSHVVMGLLAVWAMASRLWAADQFAAMVSSADLGAGFVLIWSATQLVRSQLRLRIVAGMSFGLLLVLVGEGLNKRLAEYPETVRAWNDPAS